MTKDWSPIHFSARIEDGADIEIGNQRQSIFISAPFSFYEISYLGNRKKKTRSKIWKKQIFYQNYVMYRIYDNYMKIRSNAR